MPRQNKHENVVVLSDSSDNDDERTLIQLSDDTDGSEVTSDEEYSTEASSYTPSDESDYDSDCEHNGPEDEIAGSEDDAATPPSEEDVDREREKGNENDDDDDDSLSNRVVRLLQEKRDIGNLKLTAYKAYLRKHGLRISGNKAECLIRIHDHWRMKDGNGETLHPRSSFSINCTGDVCKGDVVLFTQRVYQKFEKMKRSGKELGGRTVAGKVVKESYGEAKQQHTFTVEVLWSKGSKELPPLFPLLIKGRNLYRLKTFRQPWMNELERSKILDEKHQRGAIARKKRDVRIHDRNRHKGLRTKARGGDRNKKRDTASNHTRNDTKIHSERGRHGDQRGYGSTSANQMISIQHNKGHETNNVTNNEATGARTFKPAMKQHTSIEAHPEPLHERFHEMQLQFHNKKRNQNTLPREHGRSSSAFSGPSATSNTTTEARRLNPTIPHHKPTYVGHRSSASESYHRPPYQRVQGAQVHYNHRNAQHAFPRGHGPRPSTGGYYGPQSHHQAPGLYTYSSGHMPPRPLPAFHSGTYIDQDQGFFRCSTRGCKNSGLQGCTIHGCGYCCRRAGMRCNAHNGH